MIDDNGITLTRRTWLGLLGAVMAILLGIVIIAVATHDTSQPDEGFSTTDAVEVNCDVPHGMAVYDKANNGWDTPRGFAYIDHYPGDGKLVCPDGSRWKFQTR